MAHKLVVGLLLAAAAFGAGPVRIVYDTDMGNDVDDAIGLAVLHALESRGEARLLAVTISKDNRYAAPFVSLFNQYYGRPAIPIGVVRKGKTPEDGNFTRPVVTAAKPDHSPLYPRRVEDPSTLPDAVSLLRRLLAAESDGAVTIVQVGFSTNLARLLESGPDDASPLSGVELAARKVAQLILMFGRFPTGAAEYNVKIDVPAAQKLVSSWPGRIITSGFEVGASITYSPNRLTTDFRQAEPHPLVDAYRAYRPMPYDEPLWDPSAVLYAVRPLASYFSLSPPGRIQVDEKGVTTFIEATDGKQAYLVVNDAQRAAVREAISNLMSEPTRARAGTMVQ
jgi:inosine-uridine nucleoside N-ribohydrolase